MKRTEHAKIFGQWLDTTMANKGLSGRWIAQRVDVNDSVVSRWRNGTAIPTMANLARLADTLDVQPLRLAVTAGLVTEEMAGVPPYEMPEPTALRRRVIEEISAIRGITEGTRKALIKAFDQYIAEEKDLLA
jgi:transcriptional regulator with XRE-family HTH domain